MRLYDLVLNSKYGHEITNPKLITNLKKTNKKTKTKNKNKKTKTKLITNLKKNKKKKNTHTPFSHILVP